MKKRIIVLIIILIGIVSTLRFCRSGDDAVNEVPKKEKREIPIDKSLQHRIDSVVANVPYVGKLGLKVYDITASKVVYAYNDKEQMRPASCLKLLTCVAALQKLGRSYTYKTRLYTQGVMKNDTLIGDVVIKTQFDPAFNRDSLIVLVKALKEQNIKAIKGRLLLDVAFTEAMDHEEHWTIGDLKVARLGLLYHGYKRLRNEAMYAVRSVAGLNVSADSVMIGRVNLRKANMVAQIETPLHYAIEKALKNSSNINAEGLLYPLGYTLDKKGGYRANGVKVLRRFIAGELKVNPKDVCSLDDGCGLCPDNRVTADLLVRILAYAKIHPYIYNEVYESLPLSGTDGTLYDRLRKPNVLGKIKAKTGTLTREGGISSLSGYFEGADGHLIVFSIINNECPVMDGRWWQDKLCTKAFLPQEKGVRQ